MLQILQSCSLGEDKLQGDKSGCWPWSPSYPVPEVWQGRPGGFSPGLGAPADTCCIMDAECLQQDLDSMPFARPLRMPAVTARTDTTSTY